MFLRLLTTPWFMMMIVPALTTMSTYTASYMSSQAESTALPDTTVPTGNPGPPTSDTSAQFSTQPAQASVDSVTSAALSGHSTMTTGLTDGYSSVSSSTSTRSHSATPVTHSNWVSMEKVRESEQSSSVSPTLPGNNSSGPVTNTVWVPMDIATTAVHGSILSPASPENDATTIKTTSDHVAFETTTGHMSPTSPTYPSYDFNTGAPKSMTSSVTVEESTNPTHDHSVSNTAPENDTVPTKTPENVTTDLEFSSGYFSASTSENGVSHPATNHITMETATAHVSIASSVPEETYSTAITNTGLNTMETITASSHKSMPVSPEMSSNDYDNTSFQTTTDTVTTHTNKASSSLTKNESTASYQVTIEDVPSSTHNPGVSQEDKHTTTVTCSTQVTQQKVTTPVYNQISSTSRENHHGTSIITTDHITMETTADIATATSTSPEKQNGTSVITSNHITMETTDEMAAATSTSPEKHHGTSIIATDHITIETTADITTATSTSLENYSTIPGSTPNHITVETTTNYSENLTAFPTFENDFSTPASDYTAYTPIASSGTPATDFFTPVGTLTGTTTTSVYHPIESTTPLTDTDTTLVQGPATTQESENASITESLGSGTSEISTNQSPATPVDQTTTITTEVTVTTVTGPAGPPADATSDVDTVSGDGSTSSTVTTTTMPVPITNATSDVDTVSGDGSTSSTVTTTTMPVPVTSMGIPEQSSSHSTEPVTEFTTAPTTTRPPVRPGGFCPSNPCPFNSVCLELVAGFSCRCLAGFYFSSGHCIQARVFPGTLHIKTLEFQSEMSNMSSQVFQEVATMISQELRMALMEQPGYVKTSVQELREGSVVASVDNIFKLGSNATKQSTTSAIEAAIQDCAGNCSLLAQAKFNATDLCKQELAPCDLQTTNCLSRDNGTAKCICKEGYIPSLYSNNSCAACPSGERSENGKCVACPFGYGGFNCHDSYLLAVVVISCVLGSLLLTLLLAFIIYCLRWPPRKSGYRSPYPSDEMSSVWSHREVTHIPRASSNWNPTQMEMVESSDTGSQPGSKLHGNGEMESCSIVPEDMRTFKGKNSSRYSYLIQGHQNPYFIADEIKRAT